MTEQAVRPRQARTSEPTRWLDADQQGAWRAWLAASRLLNDRLSRELAEQHGLTMVDYEILVRLSESSDRRMRMSELAEATLASRSRLSHQIDRMEKAGQVCRQDCPEDRRGSYAVLTDAGFALLVNAAPDHVDSVRRHLVDLLGSRDFAELGRVCDRVVEHLQA